jgi:hypothetical protein
MSFLTYFDVVESLIVSSYGGPQDAEQRDIRTAIHRAYAELTSVKDWSYYHVHGRVITDAPYSTGTVAFDTATNVLTLTGGTFPSWAAYGHVRVGDRIARVASRTSGSAVVLDPAVTFPATFTGQPYTMYRMVYPLPDDFRNMDEPSDEYNWWSGVYVTPDQAMKLERVTNSSGAPLHWTILKDPLSSGWVLKLVGYPTERETIDFTYRRTPRAIRYSGHEAALRQGTLSRTGTSVTGTGTAFSAALVGSILRVGDTATHPGPIESMTPWVSESVITAVGGSTALTTEESGTIASSTKYIITDPIDVAPHMQQAMDSCCDYYLARIRGVKPGDAAALYQRDLRLAMEQDQLAPLSGRSRNIYHDGGWRSPLRPDRGT